MFRTLATLILMSTPVFLSARSLADMPSGTKSIILKSAGESIVVGTVDFVGSGDSRNISVMMKEELFKDHFLSMRPFKCLEGKKFYCHLPYPYAWKGVVTSADLTDLEYALLFVQKDPQAYGINLWHGIYYKLELMADGHISGILHEVDMDNLASPPAANEMRPLTQDMLTKADPGGQWLPELVIE